MEERMFDELLSIVGRFGALAIRNRITDKYQQKTLADDLRSLADKLDPGE